MIDKSWAMLKRSSGRLFALVSEDLKPDVLAEFDPSTAEYVLASLSSPAISAILAQMELDAAADVLGDLPEEQSSEILELLRQRDRNRALGEFAHHV